MYLDNLISSSEQRPTMSWLIHPWRENKHSTKRSVFVQPKKNSWDRASVCRPEFYINNTRSMAYLICLILHFIYYKLYIVEYINALFWLFLRLTIILFAVYLRSDGMCIYHNILVGLCSDLLMRLSYYIHLGYGKKFSSPIRIEPRPFRLWVFYSASRPERAKFFINLF